MREREKVRERMTERERERCRKNDGERRRNGEKEAFSFTKNDTAKCQKKSIVNIS